MQFSKRIRKLSDELQLRLKGKKLHYTWWRDILKEIADWTEETMPMKCKYIDKNKEDNLPYIKVNAVFLLLLHWKKSKKRCRFQFQWIQKHVAMWIKSEQSLIWRHSQQNIMKNKTYLHDTLWLYLLREQANCGALYFSELLFYSLNFKGNLITTSKW